MPVSATASASAAVVTLAFSGSVVATGRPAFHVASRTLLNFQITSPTLLTLYFSGACESLAYAFDGTTQTLNAATGAQIIGFTGRFEGTMPITADDILIADGAGGMIGGRGSIDSTGTASLGALSINSTAFRALGDGSGNAASGAISWDAAGNLTVTSLNAGGGAINAAADGSGTLARGLAFWDVDGTIHAPTYKNTNGNLQFNSDGSGFLAGSAIQWNASGNLQATSFTGDGSLITGLTIAQISGLQFTLDNLANAINAINTLLATGQTGTVSPVNSVTLQSGIVTSAS